MQICCSICKDIFIPHSEVSVTSCGHLFHDHCISEWFKQSLTCPQCRAKLRNRAHRVYFDVESDGDTDPSSLQFKIDKLAFKLQQKNSENTKLSENFRETENANSNLRSHVLDLERQVAKQKEVVFTLKEEIKYHLKAKSEIDGLKEEVHCLRNKLETLTNLETLVKGTVAEVNNMVSSTAVTPLAVRQLCTYVEVLKHQLTRKDTKLKDLNADYKVLLTELNSLKSAIGVKTKQVNALGEANMELESKVKRLELELSVKNGHQTTASNKTFIKRKPATHNTFSQPSASSSESLYVVPTTLKKSTFSLDAKVINNLQQKPKIPTGMKRPLIDMANRIESDLLDEDLYVPDGMGGSVKRSLAMPTSRDELRLTFLKRAAQDKQQRKEKRQHTEPKPVTPETKSKFNGYFIDLTNT